MYTSLQQTRQGYVSAYTCRVSAAAERVILSVLLLVGLPDFQRGQLIAAEEMSNHLKASPFSCS